MTLRSDAGDLIGGGRTFSYDQSNSRIYLEVTGGLVAVSIAGAESWKGSLVLPGPPASVTTGTFTSMTRYPYHPPEVGGMDWSSEGRTCSFLTGWFAVDAVAYASGVVTAIDLRFEQYCAGAAAALHGQIHWVASDAAVPPGPVSPPPAGLWTPAGFTPPAGNFVHLEIDPGDLIGARKTYDYTQADAVLGVGGNGGYLKVDVTGDEAWGGEFQAMSTLTRLEAGHYGILLRYPFHDLLCGGLSWSSDRAACNTLTGWFVVDAVTYSGSTLNSIDLRFEQRCDLPALVYHGQIHWAPGDTTSPPGPENPPPAGLWTPAGFTPPAGNYVHLESEVGDNIGAGATYDYTQTNAVFDVRAIDGFFGVGVTSESYWEGFFMSMSTLTRLEHGYYGGLQRYPFHNPLRGGLSWSSDVRGCNTLTGWFVVDAVTYSGSTLTSIDLRFEHLCEGVGPPLHGQIHWDTSDTTAPPGPVDPPPAGL